MAAKSIINELYQRLRVAAPVYCTKSAADDLNDGFVCSLTLPAVEAEWAAEGLAEDRTFEGMGSSKKVGRIMPHTAPHPFVFLCCCVRSASRSSSDRLAMAVHLVVLQEAEHAAANAAVEYLTATKVLRPDGPANSHSSRGTGAASASVSSATSGISLPGVGSKRSKSNTDNDDEGTGDYGQLANKAVQNGMA